VSNPVPKTDAVFLKHFAQLIFALAFLAFLLALLGAYIHHRHPPEGNPDRAKVLGERIAPVGGVYAGDTGLAALEAAREAAAKAAASQVAYGGTTDGHEIYNQLCHSCHESGVAGAPKMSDKGAWAPRVAAGLDTLLKHATEGFTGSTGVMPARGGNPALSDEQMKATVEWMVDQVK